MTPAAALDKLLPRWRAKLPARFSSEYIDAFIARNRTALEAVVARAMKLRGVKRGAAPETPEAFVAYGRLVERERPKDAEDDKAVLRRMRARIEKKKSHATMLVHVEARATAMLLRTAGWDAVPLLLREPAIGVIVGKTVVGVVDVAGALHVAADFDRSEQLQSDLEAAQAKVAALTRDLGENNFDRFALGLWARVRGAVPAAARVTPPLPDMPPDAQTKGWRTEANLQAMRLVLSKEPGELTAEDLQILAQYSGWGGLSIESVKAGMPAELVPESFGLIHEYYTPTVIAESIAELLCPLLPELAGNDGIVRALEPSAGIGRLIRAFSPRRCLALEVGGQIKKIAWTAIEFSKVSSTLLRALRPDVDLYHMPMERWIREEGPRFQGTTSLVVANPPYGERGVMAREDPDPAYKEKRAYAYFMRRALDLLVPGGVGAFLIPSGFLSGTLSRELREKILRRHHLLGAYRIPSHDRKGRDTVPGASVVMDLVIWRSRGGELTDLDPADEFIADGDYFKTFPAHILGTEDGSFSGDDEAGTARSWRYQVTGEFRGFPPLAPRPVCTSCVLTTIATGDAGTYQTVTAGTDSASASVSDELRPAVELGQRVGRYLVAVGADEADKAAQLWPELHAALVDFAATFGNPWSSKPLRELAEGRKLPAAQKILGAFKKTGAIVAALRDEPRIESRFSGQPDDVVAQAETIFRQQRALTVPQLMAFHARQGGTLDVDAALAALFAAEWNLDGDRWDQLYPADAYTTGNDLWARHDRSQARALKGDEQAKVQVRRLLDAIKPALFDDLIDISPQHGYVPLSLVAAWLSATLNANYGAVELERDGGFVQIRGHAYTEDERPPMAPETLAFLGFYNHDPELFKPPQEKRDRDAGPMTREERAAKKQSLAERRIALAKKWSDSFRAWVAADDGRREQLVYEYNRVARGRVVPTYSPEPLDIVRWGAQSPKLKAHQIAGARRVLAQRGGLVAFDVGVGKTYTALAIIARARQEGWVRRPVILVPGSLVWKWHDDVLCTLPDYRIAVIGSKRKKISRGVRKNVITSETDTPQERAIKWTKLQTGQLDAVILSYDALARTKMNEDAVMSYVEQVEAVSRSIALRKRSLEEQAQTAKQRENLSERERALLEHGVRAWVEEILALPSDWEYDPGVAWDEIGIDMLVIDEAAAFKNLYKPQAREDGVPKFMGGGGEGSDRAWQVDFRAAAVRRRSGGAGIVLLTATPAKNSPLEFYNLIQFIDPTAFTSAGIRDPEQFIDRFLKIEQREVLDATFEVTKRSAVTGFKNLDDLRTIIFTYGEFRTAAEVGLKLPQPIVETVTIKMDEHQEAKYDHYVSEIERILENPNPEGSEGNAILGLLARLSLVALHASLEDGYNYKTALEGGTVVKKVWRDGERVDVPIRLARPTYESPKLVECAKRVAASPHCGHVIFCEPTAVHLWMREALVVQGIPRERIAILNAEETAPADRIRIAREFNGLSSEPPAPGTCSRPTDSTIAPKYDVVIANSVAYEGIDLQVRTCTVHHLDLPWTPADLEQRNGRAVRQGNTLGTVRIYYYFADGSTDGYRFSLIDGKAGWLGELIKSQVRDTNNPAAQQQLSPEDILLMISRNKEKTRALLEDKKKRQAAEARARIAKEAARVYRQAAGRFRDARQTTDAERAARLRDEGEQRLADLEQVSPEAWPWARWMYAVRETDVVIPDDGGAPVYEGLRVARARAGAPDQLDFLEFGQIVSGDEGEKIGLRAAGSPSWQIVSYNGLLAGTPIVASELPRDGGPMWPDDDDERTQAAIEKKIGEVFRYAAFESLGWRGASDTWLEKWWPRFESRITESMIASFRGELVPVVGEEEISIVTGKEIRGKVIVPPTRAGWLRFLELAPKSDETYTSLRDIGLAWWGRKIPHNLLSAAKDDAAATAQETRRTGQLMSEEDRAGLQKILDEEGPDKPSENETPEQQDQRILDNLFLQGAAMADALAMGGVGRGDRTAQRKKLFEEQSAFVLARAQAIILRAQGYEVKLVGSVMIVSKNSRLLGARRVFPDPRVNASPELGPDEAKRVVTDLEDAHAAATKIMREEHAKATNTEGLEAIARATWRRARALGDSTPAPATPSSAPSPDPPGTAPVDSDARYRDARRTIDALALAPDRRAHFLEEIATAEQDGSAYRLASIVEQANRVAERAEEKRPFDAARAAIKALGLPPKKYAQYVRQAEAAVAAGKDYLPVVARARKAAEKLAPGRAGTTTVPTSASPSDLDVALANFNTEPGWRAALQRRRSDGYVLVVYPEGRDPADAIASVDVIGYDVDEIRWLNERVPTIQRDLITERLDRALWSAFDADNAEDDAADDKQRVKSPSPIQDLIDLMERRSSALGARPAVSADLGRGDGFQRIAEALRDLANPSGPSVDDLERRLEALGLMKAAEVVGRSRAADVSLRGLMRDLWARVLDELPLVKVSGRPGSLRVDEDAIFRTRGNTVVLERIASGESVTLRRIRVNVGEIDERTGQVAIEDATDRLMPDAEVHAVERSEEFITDLYALLGNFEADLMRAPRILGDVRVLLYWATAMLDAPRCQGDVKQRASIAVEQARAYYDAARRQLAEGRSADAVRRMHEALRRISTAAAEIARSCGEGQIDIGVTPPHLPVRPEDKADVTGGSVEARP
jgi:hypothetical protein